MPIVPILLCLCDWERWALLHEALLVGQLSDKESPLER